MEAKRSSRKHQDDAVSSLPEDIIFDVLVRLPVKALRQFRCVSKAWRTLISDQAFITAHRSHADHLVVALFGRWPDCELRVLDMHGEVLRVFQAKQCSMLTSSMDLICVDRTRLSAMIVDPAAGRSFTVGRDVDNRTYWSNYSFGRATPSGTYKVLHLYETDTVICEIATITDDGAEPTWMQRPPPDLFTRFSSSDKATVDGVLYFMPYYAYAPPPGCYRVAAFDLESEAWMETINGPPLGFEVEQLEEWDICLIDLNGTLCMVQNITNIKCVGLYANVWRLMDYSKSVWAKAYTIQMPAGCLDIQVLDVLDDGRIVLLNSSSSADILQFFNPSTEVFTDIMEMAQGFSGTMTFYTGSLLSS